MKPALRLCAAVVGAAFFVATLFFTQPSPAAQETPPSVVWQTDWETARQKAISENKPLFVRFHCFKMPPDLAQINTAIERPAPGSETERLLHDAVVPVRIGSMKAVDLNTFRFDYDLQLAGLVIDGRDNAILARWGTRDAQSATGRVSREGLQASLEKATGAYKKRTPRLAPPNAKPRTIDAAYPAFAQSKRMTEVCWHCHYANDARIAEEKAAGSLRKASLFMYPLPESIGVTLDKSSGNGATKVVSGSAAVKAGVRAEDAIVQAGGIPVYTSADLQAALDQVPASGGKLDLSVERGGQKRAGKTSLVRVTLRLAPGWRETEDISWRPSQGAVPPILGTWETPLTGDARKAAGLPEKGSLALRVSFVFAGEKWAASHGDLRVGDVIVAVNGQSPAIETARQFHTWYRLHNKVGQTARFTVLRDGKRIVVPVSCVDVSL